MRLFSARTCRGCTADYGHPTWHAVVLPEQAASNSASAAGQIFFDVSGGLSRDAVAPPVPPANEVANWRSAFSNEALVQAAKPAFVQAYAAGSDEGCCVVWVNLRSFLMSGFLK